MRIWGISDLHLPGGSNKSMDLFGDHWKNHVDNMQQAWDRLVDPHDVVLCPGDLSWAMHLAQAQHDLQWISRRPGLKVLLRGNHDYWWSSVTKVRAALPQGCVALQNNSLDVGSWVVAGARGWNIENSSIYQRELMRMRLSLQHARQHTGGNKPLVVAMHYPPFTQTGKKSGFVDLLHEFDVRICVYGHLHDQQSQRMAAQGNIDGIEYYLIACDWLQFRPKCIVG